ncbi:uncharacterized protein LOC101847598 [Aplysia californica]|uniref:Uncharacterized protein LOC101847598 n=1 Tax=Aplysia californica TaxID=6500 RepID=A0ABM0JXF7_APLCA|nr:uncharacterized protein LOC101847598 [Aplysia californica]XP_005103826.1 uncharacterized protein LOC101847598 [Aplysia californica]
MKSVWKRIKKNFNIKSSKKRKHEAKENGELLEILECDESVILGSLWDNCTCGKNPGHADFTAVEDFTLSKLQLEIQEETVFDYIKAHEKLVVKIEVVKSEPEAGKKFATGYAWCMVERIEFPCPVSKCSHTPSDHGVFGGVIVYTNQHVVKDNTEAENSTVYFTFGSETVKAFGVKLRENRDNKDLVGLEVCFHDPQLYKQVGGFAEDVAKAWNAIPVSAKEAFKQYAIVISHPHGTEKVISVGNLITLEEEEDLSKLSKNEVMQNESDSHGMRFNAERQKVTRYSTATCPGSSGAPVLTGFYPHRPFTHSSYDPFRKQNLCKSY